MVTDLLPNVGAPESGVFRLDQRDGLVAPSGFVSVIGTLFPIAPWGRFSLSYIRQWVRLGVGVFGAVVIPK